MKKMHTSLASIMLLLLFAYSSGWSVLCASCTRSAQTMSCSLPQAEGTAFANACCCGEMVCGETQERAPALPTVELAPELSFAPALVVLPFVLPSLMPSFGVALESADRSAPLFKLYCSLLI
jgi:hypothetical protein